MHKKTRKMIRLATNTNDNNLLHITNIANNSKNLAILFQFFMHKSLVQLELYLLSKGKVTFC